MRSTDMLQREHDLIRSAVDLLDSFVERMARGDVVSAVYTGELVSVLHFFGERCHQENEEQLLFPALEAHGIRSRGGPIGIALDEHQRARKYLQEMAASTNYIQKAPEARARFATAARAYVELMRAHLRREEQVVFEIAQGVLDTKEDERLVRDFQQREQELLGPGEFERLSARLRALNQRSAA